MVMMHRILIAALGWSASGCLADQVDEAGGGIFACESNDDCPADQQCLIGRCESTPGPSLQVRFPEAFDIVATVEPGSAPVTMTLPISIGGANLLLVDPVRGGNPDANEGYVELSVDGEVVAELTAGDIVAGVSQEVSLQTTPGAHRIQAVARRADGAAFDNPKAVGTRIVWVDDGGPHVAIARPFPGEMFPLDAISIPVEISTLHFALVPIAATYTQPFGHAHIHYDDPFPSCPADPSCDCCYVAIASPSLDEIPAAGFLENYTQVIDFPASGAGDGLVTVILRNTNHTPFKTDRDAVVYDSVSILRAAESVFPESE